MSDIIKEKILDSYPSPVTISCTSKILEQMKNCIFKIINKNGKGAGFFCLIPQKNISLMITSSHITTEEILNENNKIEVSLYDVDENIEIY